MVQAAQDPNEDLFVGAEALHTVSFALFLRDPPVMSAIRPAARCMVIVLSLQLGLYPSVALAVVMDTINGASGCKDTSETAGAPDFYGIHSHKLASSRRTQPFRSASTFGQPQFIYKALDFESSY